MSEQTAATSRNEESILHRIGGHSRFSSYLKDLASYVIGALLYAVSVDVFTAPNNIAPGGVTGISTILYSLFGWNIGTTMMLINIPLFILGLIFIGRRYVGRSFICLALISAAIDLLEPVLPKYTGEMMLSCLFGGIILGLSLGVIFTRGGSTGGTDIVARLLGRLFPHVTQGRLILVCDLTVVLAATVYYGLEAALYALIALYVSSFVIDRVLYGSDTGNLLFIITDRIDDVNNAIIHRLDRGTTLLQARGGYSGDEREVIMCAIRRNETYHLRTIVRRADPNAFIIVGDATEILGEGFRPINENEFGETE